MANDTTISYDREGRPYMKIDTNKTLAITDVGVRQVVTADNVVITLPATVVGYYFIVENGGVPVTSGPTGTGANGTAKVSVSPNSADKIAGLTYTATDDKDAINTKTTSKVGDFIELVGDGVNGWFVSRAKGTWDREA